ncbi:MAG: 3-isopropylmalate dehydratase large subunit [Gaiellales bacterium]|nr:3-isopropylmalate dehydratase large subunit [Gaiellales bacterium]
MGMTITEKLLARAAGKEAVSAGELIMAKVDFCLGNDITAPVAIDEFEKAGFDSVFDPARIALIPDHFTPNKDIKSATLVKQMREFARRFHIEHFYEVGRVGVEHALLPELGLVGPGDVVVGADSHTCTYGALGAFATGVGSTDLAGAMATGRVWFRVPASVKFEFSGAPGPFLTGKDFILYLIGEIGVDGALYEAMEFTGPAIAGLSMDSRFSMANMAIEAGAKNGIFAADATTKAYVKGRFRRESLYAYSDTDAVYARVYAWDASRIPLMVAKPHLPGNAAAAADLNDIAVDQVVIGSCTNGRIEDLRQAAEVLRGRKVHKDVRCIVIPATQAVWRQAMTEGLFEVFLEAEAVVSAPTCGPCLGGHMGILAPGERAVSTTNRNFIGRMGHPTSEVYLAGPYVAAASAVAGHVATPQQVGLKAPGAQEAVAAGVPDKGERSAR